MATWKTGDIITVQLGEHTWDLPPIPEKKKILFWDLPKEDQYWRRQTDYPDEFFNYSPTTKINAEYTQYVDKQLLMLSATGTETLFDLRERELKRRANGVWFMNKGVPTYLTGGHYFALQWCKMKDVRNPFDNGSPYGGFRKFQARFFYFLEMCKQDPACLGGYIIKPKKTGISLLLALDILNDATRIREKNFGLMSKSQDDARKVNLGFIRYSYDSLPFIMQPVAGGDNKSTLEFKNPRARNTGSKASQLKAANNKGGFDTMIFAGPTVPDAFDGLPYNFVWLDEFPKYEDPYPGDVFEKTSKTVKLGEELNGKLFVTSYVNEKDGKAFEQARTVYFDSKRNTIDPLTGMTKSELYCYCIGTLESMTLKLPTIVNQFDKYGDVDEKKNEKYIDQRRAQLSGDKRLLQAYMRQFPKNEEEAWRFGGGGGSAFDNIRLGKQQSKVMNDLAVGALPYMQGDLQWSGARLDSEVRFVRTTDEEILAGKTGKFRLYEVDTLSAGPLAGKFNLPFKQKLRDDSRHYKPALLSPYIAATDPTDYALKDDVTVASNNAITAMTFPDVSTNAYFGRTCTGVMVVRYLYRPNNPDEYYEDLVKLIWWLGCYIYVEANKPWVIKKLKDDNLHNFLLVLDATKAIVPYDKHKHNTKLTHTTKDVIGEMRRTGQVYMAEPEIEGAADMIELMKDEVLLKQFMEFDVTNTRKYDLAMSALSNIMAMQSFMSWRKGREDHDRLYGAAEMQAIAKSILY